jgi:hypothetical protein
MQELNLRLGQAVSLTYAQEDENFKRLKTAIDALEVAVAGAGLGTVTSVGLALPNIFTVTISPVTTTGSLTATLASQSANRVFASPNGSAGTPTFRSLDNVDLPVVSIAKGGLNLTTIATANQVLASNLAGTAYEGRTITPSGGLTVAFAANLITLGLNPALINITDFAGTLTSAKGGTGFSGPFAINQILLGNGSSSWTSAVLTAGSGISITSGAGLVTIANTAAVVSQLNTLTGNVYIGFGSSGTDLNVTTPTTGDITLNIPSASASNRGVLTTADWTTFNNKVGGSGTAGKIPIFTGTNSVGNSLLTYASAFSTGTVDFASGESGSVLKSTGTTSGEVRAGAPTFVTYIQADATASNLGWTNAKPLNFIQGSTTRASFDASGNFAMNGGFNVLTSGNVRASKGFALNGWAYHNVVGTYTFPSNESYGVVLGTASDNTMTIALPTAPMDGQEICILCEEAKTLTLTSAKTIFGHNAGVNIDIQITGGASAGAAAVMVKYAASAGPTSVGAWFITGL